MKIRDREFKDLIWPSFSDAMVLNLSIFVFMFIIMSLIMIFLVKEISESENKNKELAKEVQKLKKFKDDQTNFVLGVQEDLIKQGFKVSKSGNKLVIPAEILFQPGEAVIPSSKNEQLKKIFYSIKNQFIQTKRVKLMIGGHSDDTPINNEIYKDNWSLSSDRARNVVKKFIDFGFPKKSIFASGFSDTIEPYDKPNEQNVKSINKWRADSRRITIEIHQEQ